MRWADLIEAQDLNGLLRTVDALCATRAWDELFELANRCEDAIDRGKQLWPIAVHIDYRIALEAPGEFAAQVLHPDVGRFAHGPLTEVAASTHTWSEIGELVESPQVAAYVAQERVLRGEDLHGLPGTHPEILELPLTLQSWEPTYTLAKFHATYVEVPEPWDPRADLRDTQPQSAEVLDEPELLEALLDLVQPWTSESNGAARAVVVEGDARAAVGALSGGRLRMGELTAQEAVQRLAWAAAAGGAHGRRRGAAFGRFAAWYTSALLADLEWPVPPAVLGEQVSRLRWYRWDEGEPEEGWVLRIALEDPDQGWAAALGATDVLAEEPEAQSQRSALPDDVPRL